MAVPSTMSDLSVTAASNSPAGSESPTAGDDFLRAIQAIIRTTNAKGSDIASASTTDIGAATGEFIDVTGTTTITALGTIAAGIVRTVRFTGALTLTHNATSLILPGSANITTANGDVAMFRSLGSGNWKCVGYLKQDGTPVVNTVVADSITAASLADSALGVAMVNGTLTASVAASALTIAIKTKAGTDPSASDPVLIYFRNVTAGTGDYTVISLTAATSFVVSSGSTLGTTSAVLSRLWIVGFNDGGTFRLGVANITTSLSIGDDVIASSTAEGGAGAADSANVFYTGTAVTSKAMRVLGYVESTQATAGTWATSPSKLQMVTDVYETYPPTSASRLVRVGPIAISSGTTNDVTGIPSWVTRITISYANISTNGTSNYLLQIGDSGGIETAGYAGGANNPPGGINANATNGFTLYLSPSAANVTQGYAILSLIDPATNLWECQSMMARSDTSGFTSQVGIKATSATLDRFRTTSATPDTFDGSGVFSYTYE